MDIQFWLGAWVYHLYKNTTGIKQHNSANSRSPLSGIDTGYDALGLLGYPCLILGSRLPVIFSIGARNRFLIHLAF